MAQFICVFSQIRCPKIGQRRFNIALGGLLVEKKAELCVCHHSMPSKIPSNMKTRHVSESAATDTHDGTSSPVEHHSFSTFVTAAIEGVFRTSREGQYLFANPALARIYGYEKSGATHN